MFNINTSHFANYSSTNVSSNSHISTDLTQKKPIRNRKLSDLLPPKGGKGKALNEYFFLLKALKQTIEFLEKGEFKKFDALVGENLCHSRALMIALKYSECLKTFQTIKDEIEFVINSINHIINQTTKTYSSIDDLISFLTDEKLEILLTDDEVLFLEIYVLTIVKEKTSDSKRYEITLLSNLNKIAPVAVAFQREIVKKLREEISKASVLFLQKLAIVNKDEQSIQMLSKVVTHLGKECPPYFWATKTILQSSLANGIPIVIWVKQKDEKNRTIKQFCVFYQPNQTRTQYVQKDPILADAKKPVIVIKGITHRKRDKFVKEIMPNEIERRNLEIFLAFTAYHRQYPNIECEKLLDNTQDASYKKYREKAFKWKCTLEDSSLVRFKHVVVKTIDSIKPLKYERDSYMEASYGAFYQDFQISRILDEAKEENIDVEITLEGEKIIVSSPDAFTFYLRDANILSSFRYDCNFDNETRRITLTPKNWDRLFILNILSLAKKHSDPLQFLLDHRTYWLIPDDIIEFLASRHEHLINSEVINIFVEYLQYRKDSLFVLEKIIVGLGNALQIQELKVKDLSQDLRTKDPLELAEDFHKSKWADNSENLQLVRQRAKDMLMDIASDFGDPDMDFYDDEYDNFNALWLRSKARKELSKIINDSDIPLFFKELLKKETVVQLQLDLMNYLEDLNVHKENLEKKIIVNLNSSWNLNEFKPNRWFGLPEDEEIYKNHDKAVYDLLSLISSDKTEKALRVVAIRYCAQYFFTLTENWIGIEVCSSIQRFCDNQVKFRKQIVLFLDELRQNNTIDSDLRNETSKVLNLIKIHLGNDVLNHYPTYEDNSDHPVNDIRIEIPMLIELISNRPLHNI